MSMLPSASVNPLNGHLVLRVLDLVDGAGATYIAARASNSTRQRLSAPSPTLPHGAIPGWNAVPFNAGSLGVGCTGITPSGIGLRAGLYHVTAHVNFYQTDGALLRLFNNTAAVALFYGGSAYSAAGSDSSATAVLAGQFELAADSDVQLQFKIDGAGAFGRGLAAPGPEENIFAYIDIYQLAPL